MIPGSRGAASKVTVSEANFSIIGEPPWKGREGKDNAQAGKGREIRKGAKRAGRLKGRLDKIGHGLRGNVGSAKARIDLDAEWI